jgi:hypothetical protein
MAGWHGVDDDFIGFTLDCDDFSFDSVLVGADMQQSGLAPVGDDGCPGAGEDDSKGGSPVDVVFVSTGAEPDRRAPNYA